MAVVVDAEVVVEVGGGVEADVDDGADDCDKDDGDDDDAGE